MKKENLTETGLPKTVKLFVRLNLSPYNEKISFNCKELRRKGYIYITWLYSGSVFIKTCRTDEEATEIHHLNQLPRPFEDFKFGFKKKNKVNLFSSFSYGVLMRKLSSELFNNP